MKIAFLLCIVFIITVIALTFKSKNNSSINSDKGITKGKVTKVFYRGKLPFCEFEYTVENKKYTKKQEVTKNNASKIIDKHFEVWYQNTKPQNAILKIEL